MDKTTIEEAYQKLEMNFDDHRLYYAGLPEFQRNFTRDSICAGLLTNNKMLLHEQVKFSAHLQGKTEDEYTGEEPGKIFHDFPPYKKMEQSTMYNACDTTALFLIAINRLIQLDEEYKYLLDAFKREIEGALEYIFRHTENGYFIEDPKFSNTQSYCLKVTYWKDSIIFQRENGEPKYPATYILAHVQNMDAVRCMAKLTDSEELKEKADQMYARFQELYDPKTKLFTSVFDEEGKLTDPNSDLLHMLYYLDPQDLSAEQLKGILNSCKHLETKIGYKTNRVMDQEHHQKLLEDTKKFLENPQKGDLFSEVYHYNSIWPFEQAFIHLGALKFGLDEVAEVSGRIKHHIKGTFPEVLLLNSQGKIFSFNCYLQLWTIAASEVFWEKDIEELVG